MTMNYYGENITSDWKFLIEQFINFTEKPC